MNLYKEPALAGKKGLVIGIANEQSIAWGCAKAFSNAGAELAITYLNDQAKPYVEPLANQVNTKILMPLNVIYEEELVALFDEIEEKFGKLDFILHSIAFAPKECLHRPITYARKEDFALSMDISCHSLIRIAKHAERLMTDGGSIMTLSYYGSEKVIANYNVMGPIKAALESSVRYLAIALAEKRIRVNAISPGPIKTRAASGIMDFDKLLEHAMHTTTLAHDVNIDEIGNVATFIASQYAKAITGLTIFVDGGYHLVG